ncbi:hypothetical protein BD414DRAFT_119465 [Trametes punicea]|nr:hypothetical protein BD414DRAFT_119465 [Trametes punicea]
MPGLSHLALNPSGYNFWIWPTPARPTRPGPHPRVHLVLSLARCELHAPASANSLLLPLPNPDTTTYPFQALPARQNSSPQYSPATRLRPISLPKRSSGTRTPVFMPSRTAHRPEDLTTSLTPLLATDTLLCTTSAHGRRGHYGLSPRCHPHGVFESEARNCALLLLRGFLSLPATPTLTPDPSCRTASPQSVHQSRIDLTSLIMPTAPDHAPAPYRTAYRAQSERAHLVSHIRPSYPRRTLVWQPA